MGTSMRINKNKELGISILEALMATVIVGVGFVAVFQMVNYSINSIDVSGERTKANYLVSMLAEDVIGHRNSLYGVDAADEGITINEFGEPVKKDDTGAEVSYKKFTDHLIENPYKINTCAGKAAYSKKDQIENLYNTANEKVDAPRNKYRKWNLIFETDRLLKCKSSKDIKTLKVFQLCRWAHCDYIKDTIYDQALYVGRIQINMNDGKKRKFLYFQADYKLKD